MGEISADIFFNDGEESGQCNTEMCYFTYFSADALADTASFILQCDR